MNPAVQGDLLRDHLFQLVHDGLDGISSSYGILLIPCDGDLILGKTKRKPISQTPSLLDFRNVLRINFSVGLSCSFGKTDLDCCKVTLGATRLLAVLYLVFVVLLWELDVHIMLCADACDDGALAANDFWVILWIHSDGQLEAL